MENIIEPNDTFDFTKLSLAHPVGIQGGAYFTKIEYNSKPLYIQTFKSQTRQGIVKTGKKYYCDLMFDKNAATLISWFENLEERCQKLIFDRRDTWFQNNLEESDIETAFNSTIRVYKSGKYYLVRTNVKSHNSAPVVKIYNENEIPMTPDDIKDGTNIISILEIQGIKFTARNFQIEIDLKQIMVLNDEPLFDNCLIKTATKKPNEAIATNFMHAPRDLERAIAAQELHTLEMDGVTQELQEIDIIDNMNMDNFESDPDITPDPVIIGSALEETIGGAALEEVASAQILTSSESPQDTENISVELEFENLDTDIEENPDELKEIINLDLALALENNLETIQLKKPNQVYFELYKEARTKAKMAKKSALLAYLEAKNIKKTYMLENLNDSDSDIDAEIDEVSESELDGL
jgi:hypothetical protein